MRLILSLLQRASAAWALMLGSKAMSHILRSTSNVNGWLRSILLRGWRQRSMISRGKNAMKSQAMVKARLSRHIYGLCIPVGGAWDECIIAEQARWAPCPWEEEHSNCRNLDPILQPDPAPAHKRSRYSVRFRLLVHANDRGSILYPR